MGLLVVMVLAAALGLLLRYLLPVVMLSLPSYVFGFPMLSPMGKAKFANISVIIGAVCHACMLGGMYLAGVLNVVNICIATCITETIILCIRVGVAVKNCHLMKGEKKN